MSRALWLCSWYPHPDSPYEGDFVQRHAKAVSAFIPVTVFYVSQGGPSNDREKEIRTRHSDGNLEENIVLFQFKKTGLRWLDILLYNIRYLAVYKSIIREYIDEHGKPDVVHVHVPMKAGMVARWMKRTWNLSYIVSEQSSHYVRGSKDDFFQKSLRHRSNVKKVFSEAAAVTNVSGIIGNTIRQAFSLPSVTVVHNTVDTSIFYYQPHQLEKFRFIHVSTLSPHHKNISGILDGIAKLARQRNDFEVVIVGPVTPEVRQRVVDLSIDKVIRFTGEIPYREVARQMQQASAFVLFSRYENFPCVVVEAICCGLPVIAADTGGTREAINASNGVLVTSENDEQLASAMLSMLDGYAKYDREKIARDAAALYNFNAIGEKFYKVYREVNNSLV